MNFVILWDAFFGVLVFGLPFGFVFWWLRYSESHDEDL